MPNYTCPRRCSRPWYSVRCCTTNRKQSRKASYYTEAWQIKGVASKASCQLYWRYVSLSKIDVLVPPAGSYVSCRASACRLVCLVGHTHIRSPVTLKLATTLQRSLRVTWRVLFLQYSGGNYPLARKYQFWEKRQSQRPQLSAWSCVGWNQNNTS